MESEHITIRQAALRLLDMNRVVILCHRSPDGDTLGSGYALCRALQSLGRQARVACSDPVPAKLTYLAAGVPEEDFPEEHVVSVDIADENLFGSGLEPFKGRVELAIDHHASHRCFAKELCLDGDSASACEVVYEILLAMGIPMTPEIASCLYTGTATDTGCFKYTNVTSHTHRVAAALIEAGCDFKTINKVMFDTKSMAVIGLERAALNGLSLYRNGAIAVITVTREMMAQGGLSEGDLDGIAALPRKIEGVEAGITIKERSENEYKVSLRTSELLDASDICARFGGGGHARAAGCSFDCPPALFLDKLLAALNEALDSALPENSDLYSQRA